MRQELKSGMSIYRSIFFLKPGSMLSNIDSHAFKFYLQLNFYLLQSLLNIFKIILNKNLILPFILNMLNYSNYAITHYNTFSRRLNFIIHFLLFHVRHCKTIFFPPLQRGYSFLLFHVHHYLIIFAQPVGVNHILLQSNIDDNVGKV